MTRRFGPALLALCALAGCDPGTPAFQATWYLENASPQGDKASQQQIYVLLVNQSTELQMVRRVIIDPIGHDQGTGWQLNPELKLEPGRALVRPIEGFKRSDGTSVGFQKDCYLPMNVLVLTDAAPDGVFAAMNGRIPSSLPDAWQNGCPAPK